MAWEEWERAKAAAAGGDTRMRLNQAGSSGASAADLVVHQDDLGAVGHEAFVLHGELSKKADIAAAGAGNEASGSTMRAAAALKSHHLGLGSELETTVEMWTSQVKSVLQACAHISNHLDYSKKTHAHDDTRIAADLSGRTGPVPVSVLNEYFK
ncbi:hypothetical protein [Streptomyces cinerochromogenes]|uniref:hypothetical protein n=1 Tax=Streptomyces cinerochromogenes TaxID=66422 RepID=UPI001670EE22|nr:hypothetical protein [Streptomyces cinerochromogenes]GGS59428.1 hypothetical protein GCM10010206_21780 [Streptomyces cinerochromogenes]